MLRKLTAVLLAMLFSSASLALTENVDLGATGEQAGQSLTLEIVDEESNETVATIPDVDGDGNVKVNTDNIAAGWYIFRVKDRSGTVVRERLVFIKGNGAIVNTDDTFTGRTNRSLIESSISVDKASGPAGSASSVSSASSLSDSTPWLIGGGIVALGLLIASDDSNGGGGATNGGGAPPPPPDTSTSGEQNFSGTFNTCNFQSGDSTLFNLIQKRVGTYLLRIVGATAFLTGTAANINMSGSNSNNNLNLSGTMFAQGNIGNIPAVATGLFTATVLQLAYIVQGPFGDAVFECFGQHTL